MKWNDDVSSGDWLRERITGRGGFATVAGEGWETYARIPHPVEVDGAIVWPAEEGLLEPRLLRHLAAALASGTATPDDITLGVWTGFGTSENSISAVLRAGSGDDSGEKTAEAFMDADIPWLVAENAARLRAGILPTLHESPTLDLRDRDYFLLTTTLEGLTDLAEQDDRCANGIQLIWPADHAWVVASEIDFDFTIVGGSRELVRRVVATQKLEAFEVREDDRSTSDARHSPEVETGPVVG